MVLGEYKMAVKFYEIGPYMGGQGSTLAEVGKYTYGLDKILINNYRSKNNKLKIGSFTSMASYTKIFLCGGRGHEHETMTTFPFGATEIDTFNNIKFDVPFNNSGDVTIGSDVWLGEGVTIMPGVTIGDGAVIATNSMIVSDVQPYAIVGGNPAKLIRYRFSPEIIEALLDLKWWELDDEVINYFLPLIKSNPTLEKIAKIKNNDR